MFKNYFQSPVGTLEIQASEIGIVSVLFFDGKKKKVNDNAATRKCIKQLEEYFSAKRKQFDLTFDFAGTDFQKKVWNELLNIPFGKTISYLQLAKKLGDPKSIRAAGTANGKNPIVIIVPCHRVIGSDGTLVGYGGGLWRKKWLLDFERGEKQSELF